MTHSKAKFVTKKLNQENAKYIRVRNHSNTIRGNIDCRGHRWHSQMQNLSQKVWNDENEKKYMRVWNNLMSVRNHSNTIHGSINDIHEGNAKFVIKIMKMHMAKKIIWIRFMEKSHSWRGQKYKLYSNQFQFR